MAISSIKTNIAAYYAQANIGISSGKASDSVARLSSGNRIVKASDDVAALSIGTSLRTNVATLKTALLNTSQGSSLLQVADGALAQISEILQRQKAIATQAGSGSLTATERSFLNQEFQALGEEIDRLVSQTNFNGVELLNGRLSQTVAVDNVSSNATRAGATIAFGDNPDNNETVIINGVTVQGVTGTPSAVQFQIGATVAQTVANIATFLNNAATNTSLSAAQRTALSQATYSANGTTLDITARSGGTLGSTFRIDTAGTSMDTVIEAGIGAAYGGSYYTAFANGFTSSSAVIAGTGAGAATAFQVGDNVSAAVDGVNYNLYTIAAGDNLQSIVNGINASTSTTGIRAEMESNLVGGTLRYNIRLEHSNPRDRITFSGGANYNTTLAGAINAAATTTHQSVFALTGGKDDGLNIGSVSASGTVGDTILTGLSQTLASRTLTFPEIADSELLSTSNFGVSTGAYITFAGQDFIFTSTASANKASNEITVGATLEETLDNAVETLNAYNGVGAENYQYNQVKVRRDGLSLVFESREAANVTALDGTTATAVSFTGFTILSNGGNLNNSSTGGVIASRVTNADFIGSLSGFSAAYVSNNSVNLSIQVGDYTYRATSVNTAPTSDTTVRLFSDTLADGTSGGYFDIVLRKNSGVAVTDSSTAGTFAARLDAAFSSMEFYQNRNIESYNGQSAIVTDGVVTGSLVGSSAKIQLGDFSDVKIDKIEVNAPAGTNPNGSIVFTINGELFSSANNIGGTLGANQTYRLTSATDANKFLEFTTGKTSIGMATSAQAASFQEALRSAFGVGDGSAALSFQVGSTSNDSLSIGIDDVSTDSIYKGATLDVLSQENAQIASDAIDAAIKLVTAVRADVGALQSRFNYAAANIQSSLQNQDAARGELLDTDIASESTSFAIAQVQLQAGISTLAQANLLGQNLLKLIG